MPKVKMNIEDILRIKKEIATINSIDVKNLELYENGEIVKIDSDLINDWRFTGLTTFSFLSDEFFRKI